MPAVPLRRRYHCDLKIAAALGVLDPHVARSLPASTLHRFRASDYSSLVGLNLDLGESLALVKRFAQSRRAQTAYSAYLRVKQTLVRILSAGRSLTNVLARHKLRVVTTIGRVQHTLGLRRTLKLLESFTVAAQSWAHPLLEHELDMTPITEPGLYRLSFLLYESNVLQDSKTVLFRVAE